MATLQVKALFDCEADRPGELSFNEGDILVDVTESEEKGWYEGRLKSSSQRGLFPINYVEPLKPSISTTIKVQSHDTKKKDTVQPENFDHISDRFRVDIKKRHILPSHSFSEDKVTAKESNDLTPTVSPLKTSPRRAEVPKPGSKSTSNVLEMLQQKSVGIRQEISSRAQNYSSPSLSNIKYRKISNEKISQPFQIKKEREIRQADTHRTATVSHARSMAVDDSQFVKPSQLNNNNKTNIIKKISAPSSPALSPRPNRSFRIRSSTMSDMKISPFYSNNSNESNEEIMVSGLKNPMPPLPSRPKSIASKKSLANRNSGSNNKLSPKLSQSTDIATLNEEEKDKEDNSFIKRSGLPAIKPKPSTLKPSFPLRSVSNQSSSSPQLECDPTLLSNNSDDSLVIKKKFPPIIPAKPSISLSSRVQAPLKKPFPPPKPAKSSRTTRVNYHSSANEKEEQGNSASLELGNKLSTKNDDPFIIGKSEKNSVTSSAITELKKKAPPPPPPSRSPRIQERERSMKTGAAARARYEILFETIQDNGYVDEEVTQTLWRKNKLSKDEIEHIWRECDSENKKILDRDGFIKSMTMIDSFLIRQEQTI